jgi:hypothetical protein
MTQELRYMKPKTCEDCGETLLLHQWGSQDFDYDHVGKKWIPMFDLELAYYCRNCQEEEGP